MSSQNIGFLVTSLLCLVFLVLSDLVSYYFYILSIPLVLFWFYGLLESFFPSLHKLIFKKKIKHLVQENGICEIYFENGKIWKKFNLSNGLLEGKYESFTIRGTESLIMNFKNGVLDGQSSNFSSMRNCYKYIEKFKDGELISHQSIRRVEGHDSSTLFGTKYELGPVIIDKDKLKEKGSSIKKLDLEPEGYDGEIERLRKEGINFKLYNYQ
tara:strand:- start:2 stop:637 length:636 start_codon:yes stop_codon:yes gene_type:complete